MLQSTIRTSYFNFNCSCSNIFKISKRLYVVFQTEVSSKYKDRDSEAYWYLFALEKNALIKKVFHGVTTVRSTL